MSDYLGRSIRQATQLTCAVLVFYLSVLGGGVTLATADSKVIRHDLECSRTFPCPRAIWPRVNFWIDVYSRWNSNDAILHDARYPSRIYQVFTGKDCGSSKNSAYIDREKEKLAKELDSLASRIQQGGRVSSQRDKQLIALFPKLPATELRRAAGQVRCQSGNRDRFQTALDRFGIYGRLVRQTVRQSGLPSDIQYLPFVESLYHPGAFSRVGAAGLWQIMPGTAKALGLNLNGELDERLDPELASRAASRYLAKSYVTLMKTAREKHPNTTPSQLNPFIITSYNYGMNGMRRAIEQHGPDFMTVLTKFQSPSFQVAVKNFYASFLAARHVAKNADRYFGPRDQSQPLYYQTIVLDQPVSVERLRRVFGLSDIQLKQLNPALTRFVWHGWRHLPAGYHLRLPLRQAGWASQLNYLEALPPESAYRRPLHYIVKQGDTACGIANAFQVECQDLVDMNRLNRKATIWIGQKLQIPVVVGQRTAVVADPGKYRVRQGDSVCAIAKRFAVNCDELLSSNGLQRNGVLRIGRELLIPGVLPDPRSDDTYTVRHGDSACLIAARYRVPCSRFLVENGLTARGLIFPGQTLRIPRISGGGNKQVTISHTVRSGDTACEVAELYQVPCKDLITVNRLGPNAVIRPEQILIVSGVSVLLATALPRPQDLPRVGVTHIVQKGDTPCAIARQYRILCNTLLESNFLGNQTVIYPGQKLKILGGTVEQPMISIEIGPLDQNFDFSVQRAVIDGRTLYRINAEPEETLGHYADWLQLSGTDLLLTLNEPVSTNGLAIGDALLLPITSKNQQLRFEQHREEYHWMLVEEFKERFEIVSIERYTTRRGDSAWGLAQQFKLPVWVITRYNPALRSRLPVVGDELYIPSIRSRST